MSLLDRAAAAGALTSRIDHQDAAAVLIALSILSGEPMIGVAVREPEGVVLHCEGRDDLEVVSSTTRCLISVKAQSAGLALVSNEYRRLYGLRHLDQTRTSQSALLLIGPQPSQTAAFAEQLMSAQSLLRSREGSEVSEIRTGFRNRWPQFNEMAIDDFHLVLISGGLYSREYTAVAVKLLRSIAPVTEYTDDRLIHLLGDLNDRFAKARLARGSVTLSEIRDLIFAFTMPLEIIIFATEYVRTAYGYVKHPAIRALLKDEQRSVINAARQAMRRYRRATRKHRLTIATLGPVRCIACNGPLMANMGGWRKKGIACAHCGFNPFVSLFYACMCGRPILLVRQPPTDLVDAAVALRHAYLNRRCETCGQQPRLERLQTRTFQLNIPWPPEGFVDRDLVHAREQFGWTKSQFRDGKTDPMETLLAEALIERIDHRLPNGESPPGHSSEPRTTEA